MYLINFIRAYYIGDPGEIHLKYRLLSKKVNFFQLGTDLMNKKYYFSISSISVQIFMLGPCAVGKLQIFGQSQSNITQIC